MFNFLPDRTNRRPATIKIVARKSSPSMFLPCNKNVVAFMARRLIGVLNVLLSLDGGLPCIWGSIMRVQAFENLFCEMLRTRDILRVAGVRREYRGLGTREGDSLL